MTSAAKQLYDQLKVMADVQNLIDRQERESVYLDYKEAQYYDGKLREDAIDNFAKSLSSFANTQGGVLVWGVATGTGDTKDLPETIVYIDSIERFKDALESRLLRIISPQIEGVLFNPIPQANSTSGVLIMYVPESLFKPHMANDHKCYYLRIGANSLKMEHSQLESQFARKIMLSRQAQIVFHGLRTFKGDRIVTVTIANWGETGAVDLNFKFTVIDAQTNDEVDMIPAIEPFISTGQVLERLIEVPQLKRPLKIMITGTYKDVYGNQQQLRQHEFQVDHDIQNKMGYAARKSIEQQVNEVNVSLKDIFGILKNLLNNQDTEKSPKKSSYAKFKAFLLHLCK